MAEYLERGLKNMLENPKEKHDKAGSQYHFHQCMNHYGSWIEGMNVKKSVALLEGTTNVVPSSNATDFLTFIL